jgi:hypothetical protein
VLYGRRMPTILLWALAYLSIESQYAAARYILVIDLPMMLTCFPTRRSNSATKGG